MAYGTVDDLALLLGLTGDMDESDIARAELLLDLATGEIDDACQQSLDDAAEDVVIDGSGTAKLVLPRWPVTSLTSVALVDADDGTETELTYRADYTWSRDGILKRTGCHWPCDLASVHVVYQAGYTTVPIAVTRLCLALAVRGWDNPSGYTQERLGDHSITHGAQGAEITDAERRSLTPYRAFR